MRRIAGYPFTDGITRINNNRTGITKTTPKEATPAAGAVPYYFEAAGTSGKFKVYCLDGTTKRYIKQSGNSLNLTDAAGATTFTIDAFPGESETFRALGSNNYYWNMQGGEKGASFATYNVANDTNARMGFWYHPEASSDLYGLDGATYGLMSWNGAASGNALMGSSEQAGALDAKPLTVMSKPGSGANADKLFVPNDSGITKWSFEWVSDDRYYLTATVDGSTQYLKIGSDGLSLVPRVEASEVSVIPGTGSHAGQICLKSGSTTLTYSGNAETGFRQICPGGLPAQGNVGRRLRDDQRCVVRRRHGAVR